MRVWNQPRARRVWSASVAVLSLGAVAACGGPPGGGSEAEFTLSVADSRSAEHYAVDKAAKPWMECIEKDTDGRVEFEFYPGEQLGKLTDHLSLLRDGVADIAYTPPSFFEGEMPLSEVHTLPGLFTDAKKSSEIFDKASEETRIAEVDYADNGIRHLWGSMTVPSEIFTNDKPIKSLSDIKGRTLRGSGGYLDKAIEEMGASTVTLPTPEVYQAMETGTADGTLMATASVQSYSVNEVTSYATDGMNLGTFWMPYAISTDVWDTLPEDVQTVFDECNAEAVANGAKAADEATQAARKEFESEGMEFHKLSQSDLDKIGQVYARVADDWASATKSDGGKEVLDFIRNQLGDEQGAGSQ